MAKAENINKPIKKTVDIPEDLFFQIMDFAHEMKVFKFTPAVIELLKRGLNK